MVSLILVWKPLVTKADQGHMQKNYQQYVCNNITLAVNPSLVCNTNIQLVGRRLMKAQAQAYQPVYNERQAVVLTA
jgi:hypothetical protein